MKCGAKVIDKHNDYELLEFDIGDGQHRPYLKNAKSLDLHMAY